MSFGIYHLDGMASGTVGICPLPKTLNDLQLIENFNPSIIVTMTQTSETPDRNLKKFFGDALPFTKWIHIPTQDYSTPEDGVETQLNALSEQFKNDARILIHCMGGCGRSGMVALRLLISQGEDGKTALSRLRKARPCAVETNEQELWANLSV